MDEDVTLQNIDIDVTEGDLNSVNPRQLSDTLLKSAYLTLAAIIKQASTETGRIDKLNELISRTEADLFSDEVFANLKNEEKIKLYDIISKSQKTSLSFLNQVHDNISKGMEATSLLESRIKSSEKSVRKMLTTDEKTQNNKMKEMIQKEIEERLQLTNVTKKKND